MRKFLSVVAALLAVIVFSVAAFFIMKPGIEEKMLRYRHPLAFEDIIEKYSDEYDLPPELICAVILTESSFEPDAVSAADAIGLMQITDIANRDICSRTGMDPDADLTDPDTNIARGTYYLAYLYRQFGDYDVALAAYNAGYGNVVKWLSDKNHSDDGKTLKSIPFTETQNYVARVNAATEVYKKLYFSESEDN